MHPGINLPTDANSVAMIPRQSDTYIVTYPRSGTTWLQMILYQLTTSGDMNFTHISQHIPFLERPFSRQRNLNALASPRVFKTHLHLSKIREFPGKCIYVKRNGKDVLISYYNFYRDYLDFDKPFAEFFEMFLSGTVQYGTWFGHVADASAFIHRSNVLFLQYEDMIQDLEKNVRKIISFMALDISADRFQQVLERCSFSFMRLHENKFDHATEVLWEKTQELSAGSFLRKGAIGDGDTTLTYAQKVAFDRATAMFGLSNA
jgi:hypothetical protein